MNRHLIPIGKIKQDCSPELTNGSFQFGDLLGVGWSVSLRFFVFVAAHSGDFNWLRAQGHFFGFAFFTADFLAPFFALFFPCPRAPSPAGNWPCAPPRTRAQRCGRPRMGKVEG